MTTTRFKGRRGTAAVAAAANEVLEPGEYGFETNTGVVKFGNGVDAWNDLDAIPITLADLTAILNGTYAPADRHVFVPAGVTPKDSSALGGFQSGDYYPFLNGRVTAGADGNYLTYDVPMKAGTWTLDFFVAQYSDSGKVDIKINGGAALATQLDLYAAVLGAALISVAGVVIATSGLQEIKLQVNGKNASSSNYYMRLSALGGTRTA